MGIFLAILMKERLFQYLVLSSYVVHYVIAYSTYERTNNSVLKIFENAETRMCFVRPPLADQLSGCHVYIMGVM